MCASQALGEEEMGAVYPDLHVGIRTHTPSDPERRLRAGELGKVWTRGEEKKPTEETQREYVAVPKNRADKGRTETEDLRVCS